MRFNDIQWLDVRPDIEALILPLLKAHWSLVPTWVQAFHVRFAPDRDATLAGEMNYRNRWFVLYVTGHFLDCDDVERRNAVRHEIVHLLLEPMTHVTTRIVEDLTETGTPLREFIDSAYTDGMEAAVEDIARALGRWEEEK